jgi:cytoskeleton protein RodZ
MKTVGQVLAEARLARRVTLHEAERSTRIRAEILQQIEADNFAALKSPTYIKGFIKNYGQYLGLDTNNLLALFRRQFDESAAEPGEILPDFTPKESPRLTVTPSRVFGVGVTILVLGFLGYLLAQYQSFAAAPALAVSDPQDNIRVNNGTVEVVGRTDRDATLKINGQEVQLTESGAFSISVTLPDGINELTFSAINKLGRITNVKRTVTVETSQAREPLGPTGATQPVPTPPTVAAIATPSAKPQGVEVILRIGPGAAWIEVQADGVKLTRLFTAGATQTFKAQDQITVRTGNAGSTEIVVNGQNLGKMGNELEVVTRTFTP